MVCARNKSSNKNHKFIISVMSALIFFIVANPDTFIAVRRIVGTWVSSPTGCPTLPGLVLHSVVFMLVVWGIMHVRRDGMEGVSIEDALELSKGEMSGDAGKGETSPARRVAKSSAEVSVESTMDAQKEEKPAEMQMPQPMDEVDADESGDDKIPAAANMGPPPPSQSKLTDIENDDGAIGSLAPYAPLDSSPDPDAMAVKTMSQTLGGGLATTQPQESLKTGNYMQCKCGDGSHVMIMK